ncbi:hypothetical protein EJB05_32857, partial [Eragrostis curvula]
RRAAKPEESQEDLVHLINKKGEDLRVIAVWGTSGDLGLTSIINAAYENIDIKMKFSCRAWVRVVHPFNRQDFIQSLVAQFRSDEGVASQFETEKKGKELAEEFTRYVNERSYLIVLNGVSTFEEWNVIKTCFPKNKNGSRIIVCALQVEVASLCAGQESHVVELKKLSVDQTIYAFHKKVSQDSTKISMSMPTLDEVTTSTNNSMLPINEFPRNQPKGGHERNVVTKSLTRLKTIASAMEVPQLIGREKERSHLTELISNQPSQGLSVISVWGMGGLGKTTLVKDVYQSQNLICMFEKRACVTVMRPFNVVELLRSLIIQLNAESFAKRVAIDFGQTTNMIATMGKEKLTAELVSLLEKNKCLIVLDDLSCTAEWDHIRGTFLKLENACQIIVTTRHEIVARHCSEKPENLYNLKVLEYNDALGLFIKKYKGL